MEQPQPEQQTEEKTRKRKRKDKQEKNKRRGRIIVRNLSFKTTEEKLKKHFEEFGPISEINLLKRKDGKLVGCAFIQYDIVQNAAKAIHNRSGKEFLGRPIICDWAINKDSYLKNVTELLKTEEIKEEPIEIKEEPVEVKEEKDDEVEEVNLDEDKSQSDSEEKDSDEEESDETDDDESDDTDAEDDGDKSADIEGPEKKRPRVISNDVQEGKTVFIKNVPFSATNDDVKECMSQFGPLYYALICIDPITEHSKGTAFVKFKNVEDVQKCLEAGTELTLMGNVLDCHKAVNKNELQNKKPKKEKTDSRNLYLVKEGVILAGSKAAQTVSASDMARRLALERWKTQMLRNLNMFVSPNRLVIHNLPATFDDNKLRQLVSKYANENSVIKECRIMRDVKNVDSTGKGASKGFGFVSFENHENALKVLRALNNNPDIFTAAKRPIVAFSIENRSIINAKKQRAEKSKLNNPTYQKKFPENSTNNKKNETENINEENGKNKKNKKFKKKEIVDVNPGANQEFSGLTAKVGETKMRSKFKLKKQAHIHHENLKKRKKQLKMNKNLQEMKKDFIRQPQQKQNTKKKKKEDDNFSKLVNNYKIKLGNANKSVKSKWYENV